MEKTVKIKKIAEKYGFKATLINQVNTLKYGV